MKKILDKRQKNPVLPLNSDKTVEEVKDRYYSLAKVILESRGENEHIIVKQPFDFLKEHKRKVNLSHLFMRTKEDNEEEKNMISDLKKLDQLIKKTEKEEKQLEKLVKNEFARQQAMKDQEDILLQKMNLQKQKLEQLQKERVEIKQQEIKAIENNVNKTQDTYLVSEKLYNFFSLYAKANFMEENVFDMMVKNNFEVASKKEQEKTEVPEETEAPKEEQTEIIEEAVTLKEEKVE